jgi:glycosyltransferase involved in cell wall biosynthesis
VTGDSDLVTCILPVHNGEAFLGAALDSILAQAHRPLELIVVDNGSTDGSASVACGYGPPVQVLSQEDLGPPAGRNRGIEAAQGELLCFLDADDLFHPDKLARQLGRFDAVPGLEVSLCLFENFWEAGLEDEEELYRTNGRVRGAHAFGTMLARRSVFAKVGLIDPARVHGDQVEWFARLAESDVRVEVLEEVLMFRRMHANSFSHTRPDLDSYLDLLKERLDRRR